MFVYIPFNQILPLIRSLLPLLLAVDHFPAFLFFRIRHRLQEVPQHPLPLYREVDDGGRWGPEIKSYFSTNQQQELQETPI